MLIESAYYQAGLALIRTLTNYVYTIKQEKSLTGNAYTESVSEQRKYSVFLRTEFVGWVVKT